MVTKSDFKDSFKNYSQKHTVVGDVTALCGHFPEVFKSVVNCTVWTPWLLRASSMPLGVSVWDKWKWQIWVELHEYTIL